jgi:hypothetical protein
LCQAVEPLLQRNGVKSRGSPCGANDCCGAQHHQATAFATHFLYRGLGDLNSHSSSLQSNMAQRALVSLSRNQDPAGGAALRFALHCALLHNAPQRHCLPEGRGLGPAPSKPHSTHRSHLQTENTGPKNANKQASKQATFECSKASMRNWFALSN